VSEHRYAPFYCEENVWWLAQEARFAGQGAEVVLVSNAKRTVLVWGQRAARSRGEPIVWDYHVVLAARSAAGVEVWDLDSVVGAPLPAAAWIDTSFDARVPAPLAPRFRIVDASLFVARFASDRRHMRTADGGWEAPPPPWPIIGGGAHSLERLLDADDPSFGPTIDLGELRAHWRAGSG
jgi:protein N-terminal glutamine amidohydrolase